MVEKVGQLAFSSNKTLFLSGSSAYSSGSQQSGLWGFFITFCYKCKKSYHLLHVQLSVLSHMSVLQKGRRWGMTHLPLLLGSSFKPETCLHSDEINCNMIPSQMTLIPLSLTGPHQLLHIADVP